MHMQRRTAAHSAIGLDGTGRQAGILAGQDDFEPGIQKLARSPETIGIATQTAPPEGGDSPDTVTVTPLSEVRDT